jgi:peptidoglycan hydrolase-like protein with peptidoglycan-binding domain
MTAMNFCALTRLNLDGILPDPPPMEVSLKAAVGQGGANFKDDVTAVQTLLNTAHVQVKAPKKPIAIDGLVGPETIGAIRQFQQQELGFQDGRVDPNNKTINRLNQVATAAGFVLPPAPMPIPAPQNFATPLDAAVDAVPLARFWTIMALAELNTLNALAFTSQVVKNPTGVIFPSVFEAANTHFHLDRDARNLRTNLTKAIGVFTRILNVLDNHEVIFRSGPPAKDSPFADAPMGGLNFPGTDFFRITFRPGFVTCGPNTRAAMLAHEGAHFVGGVNEITHFAMEFPIPQGQPQGKGNTRNYQQLTTSEALRNASSYAAFAIQAATGQDLRFGARDIRL